MNNEQLDKIARDEAAKVNYLSNYADSELPLDSHEATEERKQFYIEGFKSGYNYTKWVKCSEEMPTELEALNGIEMPYECRFSCHLEGGLFISDESGDVVNITHWEYASLPPTK